MELITKRQKKWLTVETMRVNISISLLTRMNSILETKSI